MRNKLKVAKLIAELKSEAENEFELHKISILEKDLKIGNPTVVIIDEKTQEFNGSLYHLKDGYYRRRHNKKTYYLHRDVYEYYKGKIPANHVIHHKDENKGNNDISNLELMTKSEHISKHSEIYETRSCFCMECGKKFYYKRKGGSKVKFCSQACGKKYRQKKR